VKRHHLLLLALLLGAVLGGALHGSSLSLISTLVVNVFEPLGQLFLRLIFMIVVPMIFSALILGVRELTESAQLKGVVSKTLLYTLLLSSLSVLIGITAVNFFKPGSQIRLDSSVLASNSAAIEQIKSNASAAKPFSQTLIELVPKNPLAAATRALEGEMISFMVFSLIFGFALSRIGAKTLFLGLEEIYAACLKIVDLAMRLGPVAVFCLVFSSTFKLGPSVLLSLLYYVLVVIGALAVQQFGVYSLLLRWIAKRSPIGFFKSIKEVMITAFATASSNVTLPQSLKTAEHALKLPARISRFVLTVGSTANQNGTALFEGITVLFLAQVYSIDLTVSQQVQVVIMSILAGVGTAGVPGGSLPLIAILLVQVGIPAEGLALVLGVDRFLDMCRTTVNVSGDLVVATLVSRKS
jgi:DAACS family dicarboxylate/amino acid:cation (Na+ or H+) symporter